VTDQRELLTQAEGARSSADAAKAQALESLELFKVRVTRRHAPSVHRTLAIAPYGRAPSFYRLSWSLLARASCDRRSRSRVVVGVVWCLR
jgi:hypothetical protein